MHVKNTWILKQVQDDNRSGFSSFNMYLSRIKKLFCHPELVSGSTGKQIKSNTNIFYTKHTTLLLSLALFLLVFCTLGLPFTNWGFKTDDWGNIYHSIIKGWYHFLSLFTTDIETLYSPSNLHLPPQAFFQGLYRPLSFMYYYAQYCIFGINPYGFLLVTAAVHAGNTVLLFLLFSHFAHIAHAFLAAAFFGFHPSLWIWFGWTSAQTYFIELFVLLLLIMSLLRFLKTKQLGFYVLACTLFLLNLFLKEQTIFLPLWLMGAFYLYDRSYPLQKYFLYTSGFWAIALFYITVRLHFFPLTKQTGTLTFEPTWASFITRMSSRVFDFVTYGNDLLGFSWLPWGHQVLKGSLIIASLCALSFLFWHNSKKSFVLFCLLSTALFSWPAILMHYQPRYIYMAIPWTLLAALLLVTFYQGPHFFKTNHLWIFVTTIVIACNALFLMHHLRQRQKTLHTITTAFYTLVNNPATNKRSLCFFNLPTGWFEQGTAQAIWMLRNDNSKNMYQCNSIKSLDEIAAETAHDNPLFITWDYKNNIFTIV